MKGFFSTWAIVRNLFLIFGFILTHLACVPLAAQENDISFCYNDWPPYASTGEAVAKGISIDVMSEAASRAGLAVSFYNLPWNRCLEMVRQGDIDGVLDAAERTEFLQGPASFSVYTNTFWVHKDSKLQRLDFLGLKGKTIGLVDGYSYPLDLLKQLEQAETRIDYAVDDETNIRKLAFGRVDAIVADYASTLVIAKHKELRIRPLAPTHSWDQLYPSLNPNLAAEHKALNETLDQMLDEGIVDQIYREYLGIGFADLHAE